MFKKKSKKKKHLDRNSNNFIKKLKNKHLDPTWCRGESVLLVHWVMVAAHLMDRYIRSAHLWPLMYALIDQHFILIRERERWRERNTNRERGGREKQRDRQSPHLLAIVSSCLFFFTFTFYINIVSFKLKAMFFCVCGGGGLLCTNWIIKPRKFNLMFDILLFL